MRAGRGGASSYASARRPGADRRRDRRRPASPNGRDLRPAHSILLLRRGRCPRREAGTRLLRLAGGKVLVTGGADGNGRVLRSAELFDPRTGRFTRAGRMQTPRHKHALVALPGGGAVVIGGSNERDFRGRYASAEVFAPRTRRFSRVGSMATTRFKFDGTAVLVRPRSVIVAGGERDGGDLRPVEAALRALRIDRCTALVRHGDSPGGRQSAVRRRLRRRDHRLATSLADPP